MRRAVLYAIFAGILAWAIYRDVAHDGFAPALSDWLLWGVLAGAPELLDYLYRRLVDRLFPL